MDDNDLLEAPKLPDGYRFKVVADPEGRGFRVTLQKKERMLLMLPVWRTVHREFCWGIDSYSGREVHATMHALSLLIDKKKARSSMVRNIEGVYPPKRYVGKE